MIDATQMLLEHIARNGDNETLRGIVVCYLTEKWAQVCGEMAAGHSAPARLDEKGVLLINTDNPAWSHTFFMQKTGLIKKINNIIPVLRGKRGLVVVKDLYFRLGKVEKWENPEKIMQEQVNLREISLDAQEKAEIKRQICAIENKLIREKAERLLEADKKYRKHISASENTFCLACGVPIVRGKKLCNACFAAETKITRKKIVEIFKNLPWIDYKKMQNFVKCDIILYEEVREGLLRNAIEKIINDRATWEDKLFAVMLREQKSPEEVSGELLDRKIKEYRGRWQRAYAAANGKPEQG